MRFTFRLQQDRLLQRKGIRTMADYQIITTVVDDPYGIVPNKVSDREAGTNRSGNTGRTRLLYREGVFFYTQGLREQRAAQQSVEHY